MNQTQSVLHISTKVCLAEVFPPAFNSGRTVYLTLAAYAFPRSCLFGGEIGKMKNFGEKMGRKFFLECVWLVGEEGK